MTETATAVAEKPEVEAKPVREKKVVVATPCACQNFVGQDKDGNELSTGCTEDTIRTFKPGHDAKLKSLLIKTAVAGNKVTKIEGDDTSELEPLHAAELFGFRTLVEKSVDGHQAKQDARDAKAKVRADKKAATERTKAEAKAKREQEAATKKAHAEAVAKAAEDRKNTAGPATAKVGRNKFDGAILDDGTFKYTDAQGKEVEVTEYTVVIDPASVPVPTVDAN